MCWSRTNCPHKSAMPLTMKYCIHYSLSSLFYINLVFYNRIIKHAWSYIFRIELEARVTFDDFTHKAYSPYIQMGLCKVVHQIFRVYCADKICTQASHEFVLVTDNFFFHPLPSPAWHMTMNKRRSDMNMVSAVMKAAPTRNHAWQGHKTGTAIHILHNAGRQTIFKSCTHKPARNELSSGFKYLSHYLVHIWSRTRMNNSFHGGSTTATGQKASMYGQTLSSSVSFCDDYNFKVFLL